MLNLKIYVYGKAHYLRVMCTHAPLTLSVLHNETNSKNRRRKKRAQHVKEREHTIKTLSDIVM